MISKKDLSDAEMDTLTKSCSPTIVITANGEVQAHEEANVYVKELDIFLTMKVLENTPAVLSLGKLCDENGYSYEWINGQKPHPIKNGIRIPCNTENFVPIVVPGLSSSSSGSSSTSTTPSRQESHCSSSSSSSSSSPTVSEIQTQERGDRIESDISPVHVSTSVDDRSVWQMPRSSPKLQRSLVKDNGHSLVQVPRRSGFLWKRIVHKEFGIISRKRCCWNWQKADVLFSVQQLHCPGVSSKAKDTENCRFTIAADQATIETIFRIIVSANQLSLYGALANMCEEYESLHDRSGQPDKSDGTINCSK